MVHLLVCLFVTRLCIEQSVNPPVVHKQTATIEFITLTHLAYCNIVLKNLHSRFSYFYHFPSPYFIVSSRATVTGSGYSSNRASGMIVLT
jgi:hypothetical protein